MYCHLHFLVRNYTVVLLFTFKMVCRDARSFSQIIDKLRFRAAIYYFVTKIPKNFHLLPSIEFRPTEPAHKASQTYMYIP